ncbi:MAG TPA: hypothetical protein VFT22_39185 [Kofleriaceae bacterium]|nr:hypothetical protein [Kofleriaceae bacterium]
MMEPAGPPGPPSPGRAHRPEAPRSPQRRTRLGWLGPAIALAGTAVAAAGVWFMVHARPTAGAVIDTIPVSDGRTLVVRAEAGGDRAFVELHDGEAVVWQALVPHYGGRPGAPGIAWSRIAVTVRIVRNGRAELFALAMRDASKLGGMRLAPDHGPILPDPPGPITLTDHVRSYEIVSGPDWHQLVAIDLGSGQALWSRELGPAPVQSGGTEGDQVWVDQGAGRRSFTQVTGQPAEPGAKKTSPTASIY